MEPTPAEATAEQHVYVPFSRSEERKRIDELGLSIGALVRAVWRTRETLDEEHGQWETTTLTITGAETDELGRERWLTEFEIQGQFHIGFLPVQTLFEVAELTRIRAPPRRISDVLNSKRPREQATTPGATTQEASAAQAQAIIDAKRGKPTVAIQGGEGLRAPASTATIYAPLFPHIWWARAAEQGTCTKEVAEEWRDAAERLRNFLGATFRNQSRRDSYQAALENLTSMVFRPPPASRLDWRGPIANVRAFLSEIFSVTHSQKVGDAVSKRISDMFDEGLLDMEVAVRRAEKDERHEPQTHADPDLAQQNRLLQSQVSALAARVSDDGGRGRGGRGNWRGRGRGRGGGFRP
jgi:hypothetical protein